MSVELRTPGGRRRLRRKIPRNPKGEKALRGAYGLKKPARRKEGKKGVVLSFKWCPFLCRGGDWGRKAVQESYTMDKGMSSATKMLIVKESRVVSYLSSEGHLRKNTRAKAPVLKKRGD